MKIFKYEFIIDSHVTLPMNRGAKVLSFQNQNGSACIWALIDEIEPIEDRVFKIYGTGHKCFASYEDYVGTAQFGVWVWHLFEVNEVE